MKNLKAGLLTLAFIAAPSVAKATPPPFTDEPAFTLPDISDSKIMQSVSDAMKKINKRPGMTDENPINPPSNGMLAIMGGLLIAGAAAGRKHPGLGN